MKSKEDACGGSKYTMNQYGTVCELGNTVATSGGYWKWYDTWNIDESGKVTFTYATSEAGWGQSSSTTITCDTENIGPRSYNFTNCTQTKMHGKTYSTESISLPYTTDGPTLNSSKSKFTDCGSYCYF